MTLRDFKDQLNEWGKNGVPFLFLIDFEKQKPVAIRLTDVDASEVLYTCNGMTNAEDSGVHAKALVLEKFPMTFSEYQQKFDTVRRRLEYGDSYLTNLTIRTKIKVNDTLRDLFYSSKAKYKLWYRDQFLVFSPEIFVRIENGKIFSYPMKGTIDASVPSARSKILADVKELAEHVTIVDLIRNDLSEISTNVRVNRFRYVDEIQTSEKKLLQVSSEIMGDLQKDYLSNLGEILVHLLPAGSVSGAPKVKTVEIIKAAEKQDRGYYTGVFGVFDGKKFDSGVMIRFIEREASGSYYYRSGGGITTQSIAENEFQEAIDKVYVPIN
jgi:para-aminobenzoate synthetase component I